MSQLWPPSILFEFVWRTYFRTSSQGKIGRIQRKKTKIFGHGILLNVDPRFRINLGWSDMGFRENGMRSEKRSNELTGRRVAALWRWIDQWGGHRAERRWFLNLIIGLVRLSARRHLHFTLLPDCFGLRNCSLRTNSFKRQKIEFDANEWVQDWHAPETQSNNGSRYLC